ncbi:HISTONE-LYSINE N-METHYLTRANSFERASE H3 LYSINE-9 SPECIFIC SUVH4 [Salix koriyanagi]|uniref:HISTONE-LYSINE N-METHYLTRANSFERASE H3 LYSINE-9 SPECIFIC SUVH4 n=1 Tax=Salix koriyanagi TaxID=2511006 RepID=A0A9Q0YUW5_9ROSI|nr:HISTONE-LYSINE N-METHYLTRANSFERASE H3 LYSINE-9 SPECIFIC SUVH4 [Salix koriyanagi]
MVCCSLLRQLDCCASTPGRSELKRHGSSLPGYTYCKSLQIAKNVKLPANVSGCNCQGTCVDPRTCACAKLNGSDFPYVQLNGGRLIEARAVVFECGPNCGCGPGCVNRTSQRGIKHRLEVFRTPKKGWAVRSWEFIPAGAPVCEYIGALVRTEDTDHVCENNYIFDIDCLQTMRGLGGRERRLGDVSVPSINCFDGDDQKSESVPEFCIDAGSTGNIARFINHSCEPNLFVQCVLSSHHDVKLARVMLFAADNIPPMQELTYDYGYALDSVYGPSGKIKQMPCYCGAADCRKRLF